MSWAAWRSCTQSCVQCALVSFRVQALCVRSCSRRAAGEDAVISSDVALWSRSMSDRPPTAVKSCNTGKSSVCEPCSMREIVGQGFPIRRATSSCSKPWASRACFRRLPSGTGAWYYSGSPRPNPRPRSRRSLPSCHAARTLSGALAASVTAG